MSRNIDGVITVVAVDFIVEIGCQFVSHVFFSFVVGLGKKAIFEGINFFVSVVEHAGGFFFGDIVVVCIDLIEFFRGPGQSGLKGEDCKDQGEDYCQLEFFVLHC